jgi:hypothetical protein
MSTEHLKALAALREAEAENKKLREMNEQLLEQIGVISVDYGVPMDGRVIFEALRQDDRVQSIGVISLDKVRTITVRAQRDDKGGVSIALVDPDGKGLTFTEALSSLFFGTAHLLNQQDVDMMTFAETARGFFRGVANYIAKPPPQDQN